MRLPIPDDWDGQAWTCVEVQWPDSPKYIGILMGFLTQMARGRFWNESTGSIIDAQAVGWEVHMRNLPLVSCSDDNPPVPPDKETIYQVIGGEDCEENEMGCGCYANPKAFKIEDGQLWVLDVCGDWVVVGQIGQTGEVAPDDPTFEWPDDIDTEDNPISACGKATGAANLLVAVGDYIWDNSGDPPSEWTAGTHAYFPSIRFGDADLWGAYIQAQIMQLLLSVFSWTGAAYDKADVVPSDLAQYLACQLVSVMDESTTVDKDLLYEAARVAFRSKWGLSSPMIYDFWQYVLGAIGEGDLANYALAGLLDTAADCTCPGEETPYDGIFEFVSLTTTLHPTWIDSAVVENNGKRIVIQWTAPDGNYQSDEQLRLNVQAASPFTTVKIRTFSVPGYDVPKQDWYTGSCPGTPSVRWIYPNTNAAGSSEVRTDYGAGAMDTLITYAGPTSPTVLEWKARKCPDNPGGPAVTYQAILEVVEIDGVPV